MLAGLITSVAATLGYKSQRERPGQGRQEPTPVRSPHALLLGVILLIVSSCSSTPAETADAETKTVTAADASGNRSDARPTVTFGVTGWTGARLTVALAELLIERRLGYPVDVVEVEDNGQMMDDLEANELDAVLEVWPSEFLPESQDRLATSAVTNLGELGVVAKPGWFVPRYVVTDAPELGDWEAYQRPETARLFATDETGSRGRFLGTDPAWFQYDEQIIQALSIPFDVEYSGSEGATIAELERLTDAGQPVLLYWWTPSPEVTRFDLVPVELPERTEACNNAAAAGELQRCEYAEEAVIKLGAADLADRLPDLHRFLTGFSLSTEQQLAMIDLVDNQGLSVVAVVEQWADENQDQWEPWLDS